MQPVPDSICLASNLPRGEGESPRGTAPAQGIVSAHALRRPGQPGRDTKRMPDPAAQVPRPPRAMRIPAGQVLAPEADCAAPLGGAPDASEARPGQR